MNITRESPLRWPPERPRTPPQQRRVARFYVKTSTYSSARRPAHETGAALEDELDRLGADNVVITSALEYRADGLPRAKQPCHHDPGVAIYFDLAGRRTCIACDTYTAIGDNLWAIVLTIEATRGILRWGAATIETAFGGYAALPDPNTVGAPTWWEVLGITRTASADEINAAYRRHVRAVHPDAGGNGDARTIATLQRARDEGLGKGGRS